MRRDQALVLDARREHVRHQDVGDGEVVRRNEAPVGEPALEVAQRPMHTADQEFAQPVALAVGRPVVHHQAQQRGLDGVHRREVPAQHLRLSGAVIRDQAPRPLRQVDDDGRRLRQRHPVVVDGRELFERTEPPVVGGAEVARGVVHADHLVGHLHLIERLQHAQVARVAVPCCSASKRSRRGCGTTAMDPPARSTRPVLGSVRPCRPERLPPARPVPAATAPARRSRAAPCRRWPSRPPRTR